MVILQKENRRWVRRDYIRDEITCWYRNKKNERWKYDRKNMITWKNWDRDIEKWKKMKWIIFNRNWGKDIKEREEVKKLKATQEEIKKEELSKKEVEGVRAIENNRYQ